MGTVTSIAHHLAEILAFAAMGAVVGFLTPTAVQKVVSYKMAQKALSMQPQGASLPMHRSLPLVSAVIWAMVGQHVQNGWTALVMAILLSFAILIGMIDLKARIIPNELVVVMLLLGVALQLLRGGALSFVFALISMIAAMGFFIAGAALAGSGSVGAGDVKLAGVMGFILGYPSIVFALFIMSLSMLLFILAGLVRYKLTRYSTLPLAPFMMLGLAVRLMTG